MTRIMKGWSSMLQEKIINTIRVLSAEAIEAANSGHPGLPLGAAPMAYTLWSSHMKHNPLNPNWENRDRFVLSAGHGSMLMYSLLHLFDYGLPMSELKSFRQLNSLTPGHPEYGHTKGIEISTGPLGQGIANAVGFAMAEAHLAAEFNTPEHKVVDHYTFALSGDGCLMEGISYEAASLAGTLKLGKLILLYDSNKITIEGNTDIAFTENVANRFEAMHWQVLEVEDGNDIDAIGKALISAKAEKDKPTLIIVKTIIGYGCPSKQGSHKVHGSPLGADGIAEMKKFLGMPEESFYVDEDVKRFMKQKVQILAEEEAEWHTLFKSYEESYPEKAAAYKQWFSGDLPMSLLESDDFWSYSEKTASRSSSGKVLNKIADVMPNLFGGSADLAPSNNSDMKARTSFSATNYAGSNLHFGVREHAMAAITNGIQAHGGLRAYAATFFVFSDYMKPSMRLAAMMKLPVTYILTHDSIGVGEDGPTHQPIEQLAMLRSIPNLNVIRPADAREVSAAWYTALTSTSTPTALVLSRQNLEELPVAEPKLALKGAYVVSKESEKANVVLVATGSEVSVALKAKELLKADGVDVRVVSMPCQELFDAQAESYKAEVLPKDVLTVSIEAATTFGWGKYADVCVGRDDFGLSAPGNTLFDLFGFTGENVAKIVKSKLV